MNNHRVRALFFDLDGTLLDTAPDLTTALNDVLTHHQRQPVALELVRPRVAHGSRGILHCGFTIDDHHPDFETLRTEFLHAYQAHLTDETQLFDGISNVLDFLDEEKIPWGIITNKPGWLAEPLLTHFNLDHRYRCLISGDSLPKRKPDPLPLLHACQLVTVDPKQSAYVGDAHEDIQAAKAAGMLAVVAQYGYGFSEIPVPSPADAVIPQPVDIIQWLMV